MPERAESNLFRQYAYAHDRDLNRMLAVATEHINDAYADFTRSRSPHAREFDALKLQSAMFQYEACIDVVALARNNPQGFALRVAMKGLVHRMYEYEQQVSKFAKRAIALAAARGTTASVDGLRAVRRECRAQLAMLRSWDDIRNKATGHYDEDTANQVRLLDSIGIDEVMAVFNASMRIDREFLALLKEAGRGGPLVAFGLRTIAISYGPGLTSKMKG